MGFRKQSEIKSNICLTQLDYSTRQIIKTYFLSVMKHRTRAVYLHKEPRQTVIFSIQQIKNYAREPLINVMTRARDGGSAVQFYLSAFDETPTDEATRLWCSLTRRVFYRPVPIQRPRHSCKLAKWLKLTDVTANYDCTR